MPGQHAGERVAALSARGGARRSTRSPSLALAWPWLSGAVAIPYDAKSQFYPQLAFLARSLAAGQSPFWTPNVFAGWPQIADPQSLIFSPLHFVVALLDPSPSPWLADALVFALLFIGGLGVILLFPRPRLACRRRAGRGAGVFVRRLGRLAHPARRPDRKPGVPAAGAVAAGARAGALVLARRRRRRRVRRADRARPRSGVADRGLCAGGLRALALVRRRGLAGAHRRERQAAGGRRRRRRADRRRAGDVDRAARRRLQPAGDRLRIRRPRLAASGRSADAGVRRRVRRVRLPPRILGTAGLSLARGVRPDRSVHRAERRPDLLRRAGRSSRCSASA